MRPKLYSYHRNSAGERVRIALHLKGVPYDYVSAPAMGEAYRAINPQGLMPALEIGGKIIAQSAAILEYLEETHPNPPLLPTDPILRAQARGFSQLITADLHPINNNRVRKFLAQEFALTEDQLAVWYNHWVRVAFTALEADLRRRPTAWPFCFGTTPGWADLHLIPQVANARRFGCDLAPYPLLTAIDASCTPLEPFRLARPENQPDFSG